MNTFKLVIGDWSCDGHEKSEFFYFKSNITEAEIKEAYLQAVKKCGVGLHRPNKGEKHVAICTEYEERNFPMEYHEKLVEAGVNFEAVGGLEEGGRWSDFGSGGIAKMFLELVKTVRPDFTYEPIADDVPCINGFWSKDFNIGIGYGVF